MSRRTEPRSTSSRRSIHVEAHLSSGVADVWRLSQDPTCHQRWDVRFGRIEPTGPGLFRYSSLGVAGIGQHAGERRRADGSATSALTFRCDDPRSPIVDGSGFWRYAPRDGGGTTFATGYDYTTRYPRLDLIFRPAMAWGTAWSFDRLRLWADRGLAPELTGAVALLDVGVRVAAVATTGAVLTVATGLVPAGLLGAGLAGLLAARLPALPWTPSARRTRWGFGR